PPLIPSCTNSLLIDLPLRKASVTELRPARISSDIAPPNYHCCFCFAAKIASKRPQLIAPSLHIPSLTQVGPAFSNNTGAAFLHSASIFSASCLISHWARLQQRRLKKFIKDL